MSAKPPRTARAVVIGGGVVGTSVAFHLAKRGVGDIVLLERAELTSGTTWHAAGLLIRLRPSYALTKLAKYTTELVAEIEGMTGMATGYRRTGSILVARTSSRWEEIKRTVTMARICDVDAREIAIGEMKHLWPFMDERDAVGAVYQPEDGVIVPSALTLALAAAGRHLGVNIFEHTAVRDVIVRDGRVAGVRTDEGEILADVVVNASGMWARELGSMNHVSIPLHAVEHSYVVTEPIPQLGVGLPFLRCPDDSFYAREYDGRLLVGFFEPNARPWATKGIPEGAAFTSLPADRDRLHSLVQRAASRLPILQDVTIERFFAGPESFTADGRFVLGEAPTLAGYWIAAGFNSGGIATGGGAGRVLADWIVDGTPSMSLWEVDARRFMPFQGNRRYLHDRSPEIVGLHQEIRWPFRQMVSARGIRRTPFHDRLENVGACFGEAAGWERANWFAPSGMAAEYEYSFGRQNWFDWSAEEHRAVRNGVGIFDASPFGKILVSGPDAEATLNQICTADVSVDPGRVVYTQWLNPSGGIEADLTVTRISDREYLVLTAGASVERDFSWLNRHIPDQARCFAIDVSNSFAMLSIAGPRSRELLSTLTDADLSPHAFDVGDSRMIDLGYAFVRASRFGYAGELGFELLIPSDVAVHVYDTIVEAGRTVGLRHYGVHAMNSLRLEKAFRSWGHDISDEDTPLEAGLSFTAAWSKNGGFVGRDALLKQKEAGVLRRLASFALEDPEPVLAHNEAIWRDGVIVGKTTSGWYGHTLGRGIGLGYVRDPAGGVVTSDYVTGGAYELEIAGIRYPASVSLRPLYDPNGERVRA